jgi:8-oxo-dGTP pyrophosphatase MutT (NUDIX family)
LGTRETRLRIGGVVTRDVAHYHGVPHGAVQVAVVVCKDRQPHILLHKRSKWKKTAPDKWDICGGHIDATQDILQDTSAWGDQGLIEALFAETALREANEEVVLLPNPDFRFKPEHLKCFGGPGAFECGFDDPRAENREFSALYAAFVPKDICTLAKRHKVKRIFRVTDSVGMGGKERETVALEPKLVALPELAQAFIENPDDYADGITRVLRRAVREPGTMKALTRFLESYYHGVD